MSEMKHENYLKQSLAANTVTANTTAPLVKGEFIKLSVAENIGMQAAHIAAGEADQMGQQGKRLEIAATILSGVVSNSTLAKGDEHLGGVVRTALVMADMLWTMAVNEPNTLTTEPPIEKQQ